MPWYLPACGEVGYSIVRRARIQYAMSQVDATAYNTDWMWSSTEYNRYSAWFLTSLFGEVDTDTKNSLFQVRPFAAF